MKFTSVLAPDFDLEKTLDSGQVFHWEKVGAGFVGSIGDRALYLEQRGEFLKVRFGGTQNQLASGDRSPELSRVISRLIIRWGRFAIRFRRTR